MDPLRGPGPSKYGPPIFTTLKITEVNKNKISKLKKNEFTVIFQININ